MLHFVGHGFKAGGAALAFEKEDALADRVEAADLAELVVAGAQHVPELVVLSACFSEACGAALVDAGVPYVIAIDRDKARAAPALERGRCSRSVSPRASLSSSRKSGFLLRPV